MQKSSETRVTFIMTASEKTELKIMALLTKRTMSEFIRLTLIEKIKELKNIQSKFKSS